jgi:hypothetical protein
LAPLKSDATAVALVMPQCIALAPEDPGVLYHVTDAEIAVTMNRVRQCLLGTMSNPIKGSTRIS